MSASPTPTVAHPLTLSLTNPVSRLCQSPSPPSHRHPVTVSTVTQCPLFHIHQLRQKNRDVSNGHHRALRSFSLRSLWKKKKKKRWVPLCKMQSVFHRVYAKKQWEKSKNLWWKFVFFYFGLCFEFLIELLKKIEALLFFEYGLCFWVCLYFEFV